MLSVVLKFLQSEGKTACMHARTKRHDDSMTCDPAGAALARFAGSLVYIAALAGPLFFARPLAVAPAYYAISFAAGLVLALVRGGLARAWPNVRAFQRPTPHGEPGSVTALLFVGGFPSGHACQVAFFFTLLALKRPGATRAVLAALAVVAVALYRYCDDFHTPVQLAAGSAAGVALAAATAPLFGTQ